MLPILMLYTLHNRSLQCTHYDKCCPVHFSSTDYSLKDIAFHDSRPRHSCGRKSKASVVEDESDLGYDQRLEFRLRVAWLRRLIAFFFIALDFLLCSFYRQLQDFHCHQGRSEIGSLDMENSYNTLSNEHPSQLSHRFSIPWFDIRVFYVRISNLKVDGSTPDCLTLRHIPLSPETLLEVNAKRCSMDSEGISCILHGYRADKKSEEATFVSTDSVRLTGSVRIEVLDKDDLLICGHLEMNGIPEETDKSKKNWCLNCESVVSARSRLLQGEQTSGGEPSSPSIEVSVAGSFSGRPIILTKTMQLNHLRKQWKSVLDTIPEYDAALQSKEGFVPGQDLQVAEYKTDKPEDYNSLYWRRSEYMEMESKDGELSWFNAGVRVGVGIGLGMCLGVGVGVGLLIRSYQTTSRTLNRRLL